jgi:hypothetical protein
MKKLIESMDRIEECGMDEGPMAMPPMGAPEMDKGNPVTMSVSLNASGKDHVADLIDMMKNAGMNDAKEVGGDDMPQLPMRMDMERLAGIMDEPKDEDMDIDADEAYSPGDENAEGMVSNCCSAPVQDERNGTGRCSECGDGCEAVADESVEEWANSPEGSEADPTYGDMQDMTRDGNDMHKKKRAYAAAQDGDNAMAVEAIKATLMKALSEKKKPDADGDGVPDWADKKPGKDDNADKKKGSKPKKGVVPPQFKKK